jgi:hypothetical protein
MYSRPPIRHRDARKIAGQRATYSGLSGMKMNRNGAYFFHSTRFGSLAVLDDLILSDEEQRLIAPYAKPSFGVHKREAALLLDEDFEIAELVTPQELAQRTGGLRYFTRFQIWRFEHDAWALLHLLTGITTPTRTDREALKIFDRDFAPSAHDRMRVRALAQERQTTA